MAIRDLNASVTRQGDDGFLEAAEVDGGGMTDRRFHRRPAGRVATAKLTRICVNYEGAIAERGGHLHRDSQLRCRPVDREIGEI